MKRLSFPIIVTLTLTLMLSACKHNKNFSDQEYIDFVENALHDINKDNPHSINASINIDAFVQRIYNQMCDVDKKKLKQFIETNFKPGNILLSFVEEGADLRFIRFYRQNDTAHAIIRTYYNGGISVEDWELGQKKRTNYHQRCLFCRVRHSLVRRLENESM